MTMTNTRFSLSWQTYQKNICNGLSFLQQRGELVDMTLAADGHLVKVHQVVMSLVSPFIKELITSANCPHPVIFLNKVSYQTLQLMLEYAYTGEVIVSRDCFDQFLETCNALNIRGLENMSKPVNTTAIEHHNKTDVHENDGNDIILNTSTADNDNVSADIDDDNCEFLGDNRATENQEEIAISEDVIDKSTIQYTFSNQGSLQLILNRYIYALRYVRKDKTRLWRCYQFSAKCKASVWTKGDRVLRRLGAHTHPFHDAQILRRVRNSNVFKVEPKEHHLMMKRIC